MTTHERIKLALDIHSRIQNVKAIDSELTKYNLPVLQKSAAVGAHKEERIKLAALLQQRSLEKQAIMGLLGGAANMLGKGIMGAGRFGAKQLGKIPSKVALPAAAAGGAVAGTQYDLPGAAKATGEYASNLGSIPSDIGGGFYNALQRLLGKKPTDKDPGKNSRGFALRPSQRKPIYYRANRADL
tara:strand:+ start:4433 stop:4987 length:555 start_codon:yes stop_codon:yes gene_type:complete